MRPRFTQMGYTLALLSFALLSGCSGLSKQKTDGAPEKNIDFSQIPDAQPRIEALSKSGNPDSYEVFGKRYYVRKNAEDYTERGVASWYGTKFHGRKTSSGEPYDMYAMTAAHKTLPIPAYVKVSNLDNGKTIVVRVNDRGPFVDDRIIDLSYVAAQKLEMTAKGTANVEISVVRPHHGNTDVAKQIPTLAATTTPTKTTKHPSKRLYVQLGAFSQRHNAENLVIKLRQDVQLDSVLKRLQKQTDPSDIAPSYSIKQSPTDTDAANTGSLYRVRIGPFKSRQTSEEMGMFLSQQGYPGHFIHVE